MKRPRRPARVVLDNLWYILLVNKAKFRDVRALSSRISEVSERYGTTFNLARAMSFKRERDAAKFLSSVDAKLIPAGFRTVVDQIERIEGNGALRPRRVVIQTEFGPIKVLEDQPLLFGIGVAETASKKP
jgi:hypothetical protein